MKMKFSPFRCLLLSCAIFPLWSSHAKACEAPLNIAYGPYVSILIVNQYLRPLHEALAKVTGCAVDFTLHSDFEGLISSLEASPRQLALVPGPYAGVFTRRQYVDLGQMIREDKGFYLVVPFHSPVKELADLKGKQVMILSILSETGSRFMQELSDKGLARDVVVSPGRSYERMLMALMRDRGDAAVIYHEYWELLDESIREKHLRIVKTYLAGKPHFIGKGLSRDEVEKIQAALLESGPLKWQKPDMPTRSVSVLEATIRDVLSRQ